MKRLILILLILLSFTLIGCSNSNTSEITDTTEEKVIENTVDKKDIEEKTVDSSEAQSSSYTFSSLYPLSDVSDGNGIEGTWINQSKEKDINSTMVMALNSDQTFDFYVEIVSSDSSGSAKGSGTYTAEDGTLSLIFNKNQENSSEPVIVDDSVYAYILEDDRLILMDQNDQEIEYIRVTEKAAAE